MIYSLNSDELRAEWPKSDDGLTCANLLQRYFYALLTETASGAQCGERAQAEAAANKTIAEVTRTIASLVGPTKPKARRPMMKTLHRFAPGSENADEPKPNE